MREMLLAGVVVCGVATVVSIIGTAIPYWFYQHGDFKFGLWRACSLSKVPSETNCFTYGFVQSEPGNQMTMSDQSLHLVLDVFDWWKAVKALMILGVLFLALSFMLGCLQCKYDSRQIFQGSVFTTLLGGLVIIIAVIIFGVKMKDLHTYFHAGFYLSLVGGILAFLAAILIGLSKRGTQGNSCI